MQYLCVLGRSKKEKQMLIRQEKHILSLESVIDQDSGCFFSHGSSEGDMQIWWKHYNSHVIGFRLK